MKKSFEITLEIKNSLNAEEREQVLKINKSNLIKNGGQLRIEGILAHDYVVLAKFREQVIGYTLLKENFLFHDDVYVMQIAMDNNFKGLGIGTKMYQYTYKHLEGYKLFTANVNPDNKISEKLHEKCGFENCGSNSLGIIFARKVKKDAKLHLYSAEKETFIIKTKENILTEENAQ